MNYTDIDLNIIIDEIEWYGDNYLSEPIKSSLTSLLQNFRQSFPDGIEVSEAKCLSGMLYKSCSASLIAL